MDLIDLMAEPLVVGTENVGRITVSGKLVGGRLKTVGGNIQFLGALDAKDYFFESGRFEVHQTAEQPNGILMQNVILSIYIQSVLNIH